MPENGDDFKTLFYRFYERYLVAKQRMDPDVGAYALLSLAQIHQIAGVSDQHKAGEVMRELIGPLFTKAESRTRYDELRRDSGIG